MKTLVIVQFGARQHESDLPESQIFSLTGPTADPFVLMAARAALKDPDVQDLEIIVKRKHDPTLRSENINSEVPEPYKIANGFGGDMLVGELDLASFDAIIDQHGNDIPVTSVSMNGLPYAPGRLTHSNTIAFLEKPKKGLYLREKLSWIAAEDTCLMLLGEMPDDYRQMLFNDYIHYKTDTDYMGTALPSAGSTGGKEPTLLEGLSVLKSDVPSKHIYMFTHVVVIGIEDGCLTLTSIRGPSALPVPVTTSIKISVI